jgi:hypothetical protein
MRPHSRIAVAALLIAALAALVLPATATAAPARDLCLLGGPGAVVGCVPSPGRLVGQVTGQVAGTVTASVMQGVTSWFTDTASWFVKQIGSFLDAAASPDLTTAGWTARYNLMLALATVVAIATLLLAILDAAAKGSYPALGRAVGVDVPVAAVAGGATPVLVGHLLELADWLSADALEQALQQFCNQSPWDPVAVRRRLAQRMTATIGPAAWVIDDPGLPKFGRHSVGSRRSPAGRWQGGQLPGRGERARRHRPGQLSDQLAAVPARGLQPRRRAARQGPRARP